MYSLISNRGKIAYDIQRFIVDFETEIAELPTNGAPGSTAFVIENGSRYMLNNERRWKLLPSSGTGGGGGGSIDPTATYIYDGGIV